MQKNEARLSVRLSDPALIDRLQTAYATSLSAILPLKDRLARTDRLIDAIMAGFVLGGDKRHGNRTSAAVVAADPRPGVSRRTDGQTVNINVCENSDPVVEMRRIYDAVSQTIGYCTLQAFSGGECGRPQVILPARGV